MGVAWVLRATNNLLYYKKIGGEFGGFLRIM